jgi:hypothetical protein
MWYTTLGISVCSVLLWLKRRNRKWLILPSVILSLLHPAWTFSATNGDCGFLMYDVSFGILLFVFGMLLVQMSIYTYTENTLSRTQIKNV